MFCAHSSLFIPRQAVNAMNAEQKRMDVRENDLFIIYVLVLCTGSRVVVATVEAS